MNTRPKRTIANKNPFEIDAINDDVDLDSLASAALEKYQFFFREGKSWPGLIYPTEPRIISLLHKLAKHLQANRADPYQVTYLKNGSATIVPDGIGLALVDVFKVDFEAIRREYPMHRFSPIFEVFENTKFTIDGSPLHRTYEPSVAKRMARSLNKRATSLRSRLGRADVVEAYSNFRRSPSENFNGLMADMESLAAEHTNVLVARGDLYVQVTDQDPSKEEIAADWDALPKVQACREKFHRSIDRKLGDALWGFAFCLEYGRHRKWHYHYAWFVDPAYTPDDVALVESFAATWKLATDGKGEFYNVNARKNNYRFRAIGIVDMRNESVRVGLRAIASYLTLPGLFVQLKGAKRMKTVGRGRFPKRVRTGGRPAKRHVARLSIPLAQARDLIRFI